jgi:alkylation response protein AidB-like acyl-CoA dehydrogenase
MLALDPRARHRRSLARAIREELADRVPHDVRSTFEALEHLIRQGLLNLPLPGAGSTLERFEALAELGAADLSLARLAEGHVDALAVLAELGTQPEGGAYGVWAADPPQARVRAEHVAGGYRLYGTKRYASGASSLARALVTAHAQDGLRLFDVDLTTPTIERNRGSWHAVGMRDSDSQDISLDGTFVPLAQTVGPPGGYLTRPGFWHGSVGVGACWFGGALGCLRLLQRHFRDSPCNDHCAAHIGSVATSVHAMQTVLARAAQDIDRDPADRAQAGEHRALLVRTLIEQTCEDVLAHTNRALGSSMLVFDAQHARRTADLPVYVRQHHAERDLAKLGRLTLEGAACP